MPGDRMGLYVEGTEQDFLRNALAINNNNRTRAAPQLGIGHSGLMRTLKRIANRIGALIIQHWFIFAPKSLFLNHVFVTCLDGRCTAIVLSNLILICPICSTCFLVAIWL